MTLGNGCLNQFQYTMEKDTVTLYGSFSCDGYGEVAEYQGGGIESVEAVSATTGTFDITLSDGWDYLFMVDAMIIKNGALAAVNGFQLANAPADLEDDIQNRTPLRLICHNDGVAADPASGELVRFRIVVRRTAVGPFDAQRT